MNVTRLSQRLIKGITSLRPSLLKNAYGLKMNMPSYGYLCFKNNMLGPRIMYFNSNQKPNDDKNDNDNKNQKNNENNNQKNKKNRNWKERFQQKLKIANEIFDYIYSKKLTTKSIILGVLLILAISLPAWTNQPHQKSMKQFIGLIQTNFFQQITFVQQEYFYSKNIRAKKVEGRTSGGQVFFTYVNNFDQIYSLVLRKRQIKFKNQKRLGYEFLLQKSYIFIDTLVLAFIVGVLMSSQKRGGAGGGFNQMQMNKNKKFQITKNVSVKFNDVAGLHQVKREVQQIVDFLKFPDKYTSLGATIPKGVLLTGPPGTGKTLLAKACAGQASVPFYSVSGSDFVQMFVGVGAARVRELFSEAKASDKPAIIFIDELDAIGKKRMNKLGGNDERQSTLNQLLVQMDGFGTSNKVIVMGATNRKQILDNALVRPGRFDREVQVGLPDLKGRFQIFKVHLRPIKLSSKYTIDDYARRLASLTPGFSGAEIANLCNEAAILSARHGKQVVQMIDFELSSERVIGGVERKGFVSLDQKKTVAYHECGHAVVSWFLEGADPLLKVTIIPRSKGALGFAQYFLSETQLQTKQQILDRICFILGGRCSQQHFFNQVTTGAYDDLSKAYDLAYSLIARYGMVPQIGYISFPDPQYTKPYGQKIESLIDRQIQKIILDCTKKTKQLVAKHEQDIKRLAEELLVKETLDVTSIQKILGKRPFPPNKTFEEYLQTSDTV